MQKINPTTIFNISNAAAGAVCGAAFLTTYLRVLNKTQKGIFSYPFTAIYAAGCGMLTQRLISHYSAQYSKQLQNKSFLMGASLSALTSSLALRMFSGKWAPYGKLGLSAQATLALGIGWCYYHHFMHLQTPAPPSETNGQGPNEIRACPREQPTLPPLQEPSKTPAAPIIQLEPAKRPPSAASPAKQVMPPPATTLTPDAEPKNVNLAAQVPQTQLRQQGIQPAEQGQMADKVSISETEQGSIQGSGAKAEHKELVESFKGIEDFDRFCQLHDIEAINDILEPCYKRLQARSLTHDMSRWTQEELYFHYFPHLTNLAFRKLLKSNLFTKDDAWKRIALKALRELKESSEKQILLLQEYPLCEWYFDGYTFLNAKIEEYLKENPSDWNSVFLFLYGKIDPSLDIAHALRRCLSQADMSGLIGKQINNFLSKLYLMPHLFQIIVMDHLINTPDLTYSSTFLQALPRHLPWADSQPQDWYNGLLSDTTLDRLLQTKLEGYLARKLLELTSFEPEKQMKVLKVCPLSDWVSFQNEKSTLPMLHEKTQNALLENPSLYDLVVCERLGHQTSPLWAKISMQDLGKVKGEFHGIWRTALKCISQEQTQELIKIVMHGTSLPLEFCVNIFNYSPYNNLPYIFSIWNELGKKDDVQPNHLYSFIASLFSTHDNSPFKNVEWFWDECLEIEIEWAESTFNKLVEVLRSDTKKLPAFKPLLLQLMRHYPDHQREILNLSQLDHTCFVVSKSAFSRKRIYYPELHPEILTTLLGKYHPTVWEMIFCIQQCKETEIARAQDKLRQIPIDQVREEMNKLHWKYLSIVQRANDLFWQESPARMTKEVFGEETCGYLYQQPYVCYPRQNLPSLPTLEQLQRANLSFYTTYISKLLHQEKGSPLRRISYAAFQQLQKLLAPTGWYSTVEVGQAKIPAPLSFLSDDSNVFYQILGRLHPFDRIALSRTCRGLFHRICGVDGARIWVHEGSIGAVKRIYELYKWIQEAQDMDAEVKEVLALAWPKHYWHRLNKF